MNATIAFISMPGGGEWLIIAMVGLLLFGKRLPEVGNSLGRTIVEFKKGLNGIKDEIEQASRESTSSPSQPTLSDSSSRESSVPEYSYEYEQTAEAAPEASAAEASDAASTANEMH